MIGQRLPYAGLASIGALTSFFVPAANAQPAACNVVAPSAVNQADVSRLGQALATPSAYPGGSNVTDIVIITNYTPCTVKLRKVDGFGAVGKNQEMTIPPATSYEGSMWIPWADSWDSGQVLQLVIANRTYFDIWQKGNRVAFRTEAELARLGENVRYEYDAAPSVPGFAASGGRRHLYVAMTPAGRPYFKFEGVPD